MAGLVEPVLRVSILRLIVKATVTQLASVDWPSVQLYTVTAALREWLPEATAAGQLIFCLAPLFWPKRTT